MRERRIPSSLVWLAGLLALAIAASVAAGGVIYYQARHAAQVQANAMTGGDWRRGRAEIARYGCGGCHLVPGIHGASGKVGPDLTDVGKRAALAGRLPNTPEAMQRWLIHPQRLSPGSGMPEQGVTPADARDMAAYLYAR